MNAEKHSVFAEPPSFLGVSLRLRPRLWAALICTQSCNSVQTCANPCELYGTIRGTSAPLTAPFFGVFRHLAGQRNRCITGAQHPPNQQFPSRRYRQSEGASHVRRRHDSRVVRNMHRHRLPATCLAQSVQKHRK